MKSSSLRFTALAVGLLSIVASAQQALAVPTVFFDRDDNTGFMTSFPNSQAKYNQFAATLNSFGVDDIDTDAGFDPSLTFGATGITATTQGVLAQAAPTYVIGTQALLEVDAIGFPQVNTKFTFNQPITAFGAFVTQGGDTASNNNPTTFRLRNTVANTFVDVPVQVGPGWLDNNAFFFGVTDTSPFNEVELLETGDAVDGMLYDNVVAGQIPEPGSVLLMLLGGAFALCRGARFRRS